jgi:hypothetical protein
VIHFALTQMGAGPALNTLQEQLESDQGERRKSALADLHICSGCPVAF